MFPRPRVIRPKLFGNTLVSNPVQDAPQDLTALRCPAPGCRGAGSAKSEPFGQPPRALLRGALWPDVERKTWAV